MHIEVRFDAFFQSVLLCGCFNVCVCVCVCVQGSRSEVFLGGSLGVETAQQKDEQAFVARVNTAKSVHVVSLFHTKCMDNMSNNYCRNHNIHLVHIYCIYLQYHSIMIVSHSEAL